MTDRIERAGQGEPDAALVRDLQTGDHRAFEKLYHRYKQAVYAFSVRMLGDRDAAKDIVQSAFLRLFDRAAQIQDPERFRSWFFTVVRNDCLNALRRCGAATEALETLSIEQESTRCDSLSSDDRSDLSALVADAIGRLPACYREVLILREYHDLSYREIAEVIDTNEGVVRFRLFTARKKLHDLLAPQFARSIR